MTTIPKSLSYPDFLSKVGKISEGYLGGNKIQYHDLYTLIIERLGDQPIKNYSEFLDKCKNLGNLIYWDLYQKLYPENENVKESKKVKGSKKEGGTRKGRKSNRTRKGGSSANYCNVPNKARIDLFNSGTAGVTEEMCKAKKGCWKQPANCNANNCSKIPWCYTSRMSIVVNIRGWEYPMQINTKATPLQVLAKLWAIQRMKAQPKIMPDGSRRWSGCEAYCPPLEDQPKYKLTTASGTLLDNEQTLGENGVNQGDILMAVM